MRDLFNLNGKVAIITGAGRGLGEEMACKFAEYGADVVVAEIMPEKQTEVIKKIESLGQKGLFIHCDVNKLMDIERLVEETVKEFGHIDILVNNAGRITRKPALELTAQEWDAVLDTILKGSFFCSQAVAKVMIQQKKGRIINIGSATCIFGAAGIIPYGAARGGMVQLTKGLAVEWGKYGITVNIVAPGWFETDQTRTLFQNKAWVHSLIERVPVGRAGLKCDLDGIMVFLASDASQYITGQLILVDGGYTISSIKASSSQNV